MEISDVQILGTVLCGTCVALGKQSLNDFLSLALPSLCDSAVYKICIHTDTHYIYIYLYMKHGGST